jgi:hypothetical protein
MVSNEDPGQEHQTDKYDTQSHKPGRMNSADLLCFFTLDLPFMGKAFFPFFFMMLMMPFLVIHAWLA